MLYISYVCTYTYHTDYIPPPTVSFALNHIICAQSDAALQHINSNFPFAHHKQINQSRDSFQNLPAYVVQMVRKKAAKAAELEEDALIVEYLRQRQVKEQVRAPFVYTPLFCLHPCPICTPGPFVYFPLSATAPFVCTPFVCTPAQCL